MNCKKTRGFSLTELLVAVAIVGIIGAIAIPSYFNYARKSYYTQVVKATLPYKSAIEDCFAKTKDLQSCVPGKYSIPKGFNHPKGAVQKLVISPKGVITATPLKKDGVTAKETYILTPTIKNNHLAWHVSGGGLNTGAALPG